MKKAIALVTTNKGKVASCQKCFKGTDITVEICDYELIEPRTDDIREIARSKVFQAYEQVKKPCIAIDTGFFVSKLNGFPRAFVNFALDTIGIDGMLKLMEGEKDRYSYFKECVAYYDGNNIKYFECEIPGDISEKLRGMDAKEKWSDLWYIFIPKGYNKTLAEMTKEERAERKKNSPPEGFEMFAKWYIDQ